MNNRIVAVAISGAAALALEGGVVRADDSPAAVRAIPDLPVPIASFGAAALDGSLYVLGGHVGKAHSHSRDNLSDAFHRLRLDGDGGWEKLDGGAALQSVALVPAAGALYRIGGMTALNSKDEPPDMRSSDEVVRFDPATGAWAPVAKLPEPRSSHDAAAIDGRIYVVGGWNLQGADIDATWHKTAWSLDATKPGAEWAPLPEPPFERRALAVAAAGGRIFAIGGMNSDESMSAAVHYYEPATETWDAAPDFPGKGFGMAAWGIGDAVFASGADGALHRLDAKSLKWSVAGKLATGRMFHRLVPAGESALFAIAGDANRAHRADTELVAIAAAGASEGGEAASAGTIGVVPKADVWTIAYPGAAKNRQGVFFREGKFHVFGGNNSLEQHDFEEHNFLAEGFVVDPAAKTVAPTTAFPTIRQSMIGAIGADGFGYFFGGFGWDGKVARSHADVFRYDFAKSEWEKMTAALPKPITQFGLIEHEGEFWIFGGMDFDPRRGSRNQFQIQTSVYIWKPGADAFVETEYKLPQPRRAFGSARIGDKVYLVGGMKEEFENVMECDLFDLKTREWTTAPAPGVALISPEVEALGGKLYMACGSTFTEKDGFKANPALHEFDPANGEWRAVVEEMPTTLRHTRMFADGERLLFYSANVEGESAVRIVGVSGL